MIFIQEKHEKHGNFRDLQGLPMAPPNCFARALEAHVDVQRAGPRRRARQTPTAQVHQLISETRESRALLGWGRDVPPGGVFWLENMAGKSPDF